VDGWVNNQRPLSLYYPMGENKSTWQCRFKSTSTAANCL